MTRHRSPNYPYIGLGDAVSKLRQIYGKEKNHAASREVLAIAMGYRGISGSSAKVLSALRKFGLLEGRGENLRISEDGLAILMAPKDSDEFRASVERCAFLPPLYSDLKERYEAESPSDQNLRYHLVKQGFSKDGVDAVVATYGETLDFMRENVPSKKSDLSTVGDSIELSREIIGGKLGGSDTGFRSERPQDIDGETLRYRISRDSFVELRFNGTVTQESVDKLINLLKLTRDNYPSQNELSGVDVSAESVD